jgi:hypothetical protein
VNWLWLNVPLMVLFAAAVAGIPLWLVLRRPDFGPEAASRPGPVPAQVASRYAQARLGSTVRPAAARAQVSDGARKLDLARATR